ncbi:MAG: hypothetical protein V4628_03810 [Pseudomonadota bacterium]
MLSLIITGLSCVCAVAQGDELKPFISDGCSSFPDGTIEQNELWLDCCLTHDRAYWKGGTFAERERADLTLEACVAKVGESEVATMMLIGVRVGGSPYWPTRFRWGYGWPWPRSYGSLTPAELEQVRVRESE